MTYFTRKHSIIFACISSLFALFLEIIPKNAVCNFANPDGEPFRQTYSYFDLTPFGYANFGPFLTAILTIVILFVLVLTLFTDKRGLYTAGLAISIIAVITSMMPLMFGADYYPLGALSITMMFMSASGFVLAAKFNLIYEQRLHETQEKEEEKREQARNRLLELQKVDAKLHDTSKSE